MNNEQKILDNRIRSPPLGVTAIYTMHGLVLCMALDCFGLRPRNDDNVLASEAKQSRKKRKHKTMPRKV
jgi:hypothetical protein